MTPPTAWGPVVDDKVDDWSGEMASSPKAVCDQFVEQYKGLSKTTTIEEQTADHVVVRFDYAEIAKGIARAAGTNPPPSSAKPLNRRMLIEVRPSGKDFAVRLRSFDIPG